MTQEVPRNTQGNPSPAAGAVRIIIIVVVVAIVVLMLSSPAARKRSGGPVAQVVTEKPITSTPPHTDYNQRQQLMERGQLVYNRYCVGCHGAEGKGDGPAAARLTILPRDFTKGIYKFRTTDSGSLPTDADLHRTITRGLARVSMPAFPLMPEQDRTAVITYIKAFYPEWDQRAADRKLVFVPQAPADVRSDERAARGRIVYLAMGCANCHGSDGAGTGATQASYTDAWGHPQKAFNFTRGRLKSGDDPEDVYRVFHTGLRSIMPAFAGETLAFVSAEQAMGQARFFTEGEPAKLEAPAKQFPATLAEVQAMSEKDRLQQAERNSWDLVAYIDSLRKGGGKATGKAAAATAKPATKPDEDY